MATCIQFAPQTLFRVSSGKRLLMADGSWMLLGFTFFQVSIEASARLVELYEAVARALDVAPWMLRLTAGTSYLN